MLLEVETLFNGSQNCIYLGEKVLRLSGMKNGEDISLWAGANEFKVKIKSIANLRAEKIFIPDMLYEKLNLPVSHKHTAIIDEKEKAVRIGPFLGFLIVRRRQAKKPPYSSQNYFLEIFSETALKNGVIPFVFCPQDIDWPNSAINGYTIQKLSQGNHQWVKDVFPLPNAVYNRILNRSTERKELISETVRNLKNVPNLHHFNPKFLEKWETHKILSRCPSLAPYLPDTARVRQLRDIAQMAARHSTVYIKPINGSLGTNIIRLQTTEKGYRYQYRRRNRNHTGIWQDPETLWIELSKILGRRQYIVQQGLEFRKYRGRVFDIRLLLQKNSRGEWTTTAIVGRVAAENNIFPNIAAGGEAIHAHEIWREISSEKWEKSAVLHQIMDIGINVAQTLDQELGSFAELGLDIGIDTNDHAWLIEVNSKPSRKVFPKGSYSLKKQSFTNIIEYARYVSGFNQKNETGEGSETKITDR